MEWFFVEMTYAMQQLEKVIQYPTRLFSESGNN